MGKGSEAAFDLSYVTTLVNGGESACSVQDFEKDRFPVMRCDTQVF